MARRRQRLSRRGRKLQQNNQLAVRDNRLAVVGGVGGAGALRRVGEQLYRRYSNLRRAGPRYANNGVQRKLGFGLKRGASFTNTNSKRRKRSAWSRRSCSLRTNRNGKYGYRRTPMLSMVKGAMPKRILRFQGMTVQEALNGPLPGFFKLSNTQSSTVAGDATFPVMVLDLNTCPNAATASGPVMYKMTMASTGEPKFIAVNGVSSSGTASSTWQLEYSNTFGANQQASHYISPSWYDCRLTLYGATQQATRYFIELVEASRYYSPIDTMSQYFAIDTADVQPIVSRIKDDLAYWWYMSVKNLVSNQMVPRPPTGQRKRPKIYRVLKRWSYVIPCKESTDQDATPNSVVAKLFIRDGRVLNYAWGLQWDYYSQTNTSISAGRDDVVVNPNFFDAQTNSQITAHAYPFPTRRRYIVIRAVNTSVTPEASENHTNTPSFDVMLRKKEVLQQRTQTLG